MNLLRHYSVAYSILLSGDPVSPPKKQGALPPGAENPSYATEKRCRKGESALVTVHTVASSESSAIEVRPVSVLRGGIACAKVIRFAIQWAYFFY